MNPEYRGEEVIGNTHVGAWRGGGVSGLRACGIGMSLGDDIRKRQ